MSDLARSPEQIGNAIRRVRKKLGLSQAELGEKAGLRQGTISLIEKGHPAAKLETILAVLSALELEFQIHSRGGRGKWLPEPKRVSDILGLNIDEPE